MSAPSPVAGLRRLVAFTLTTPDLQATAQAYRRWFDYLPAGEGTVSPALAAAWGAPALAGRGLLMLHASGAPDTLLRLVEMPGATDRVALPGHGWNAMEVLVRDPYSLARELEGSPFRVIIPPRPLPFDASLHAMQVLGPAGELLYVTSLPTDRVMLDLRPARSRVDRPFIAILGGPDINAMLAFYAGPLRTPVIAPTQTIVKIINDSFGLAADHRVPLGIVKLPRDSLVEVDGLPAAAQPRPCRAGELPAGFALVSFEGAGLDALEARWVQAPRALPEAPYGGRRVAVTRGAAGEWLELIEGAPVVS